MLYIIEKSWVQSRVLNSLTLATRGKSIPWTPCLKKAQISTEIYINTGQITSSIYNNLYLHKDFQRIIQLLYCNTLQGRKSR